MMGGTSRKDDIADKFCAGLETKINEATHQIIHEAEQKLRERIREITAGYALEFSSHVDIVHIRGEMIIKLKGAPHV